MKVNDYVIILLLLILIILLGTTLFLLTKKSSRCMLNPQEYFIQGLKSDSNSEVQCSCIFLEDPHLKPYILQSSSNDLESFK